MIYPLPFSSLAKSFKMRTHLVKIGDTHKLQGGIDDLLISTVCRGRLSSLRALLF